MRIPANPNDFVNDLKTNRLSYFFTKLIMDWFDSGTNSIKHSSTNTILDFFFAADIIFVNCFFERIVPVGLFGLQTKTHPFLGIREINESISLERFIVLKKVNLQSTSLDADSYSLKVGVGIKTVFLDKNAVQKL